MPPGKPATYEAAPADTGERAWTRTYTSAIRPIEVTGEVATVVLEETGYQGQDFTNHFSLAKVNGT